ncbi:kelch-like protein 32 [Amphiura filiformis]|uniref:kelch-like protein 32 n=1 Tax=Amphiura filiformis TaxID=82378 RepID=UPI003B2279DF
MAMSVQDQCVKQMGDPSHLSHLSLGLNELRRQTAFCDITIIVGDQRFSAHKAVLSCASDYFQGMFSSGFQESTLREITVPGSEESFAQILDFAYTGHFTLSVKTVVGILQMACYMVLNKAVELCAEYLKDVKDSLAVEDCFEIWSIASNHNNLSEVAQIYRSHVIQNFLKCVTSRAFLENSTASVMMEILSDEEIETDTTTEEQILQGTVMWLKYDWEQRKIHAVDLLQEIRLGLVPVDRLQEILGDELLAIPECKEMMKEVGKLSDIMDTASPQLMKSHPDLFATRNTITAAVCENVNGGESGSVISIKCSTETACYKLAKLGDVPNKFAYIPSDQMEYCIGILVTDAGHLYAAGGHRFEEFSATNRRIFQNYDWIAENNFFRYDSEKNEWIVLPPMLRIRHGPLMMQVDECIYSIGVAENDPDMMSIMERYSFPKNKWEVVRKELGFTAFNVVEVHGNLLVKGVLTFDKRVGTHSTTIGQTVKVFLYKPAKDHWLNVSSNTKLEKISHFVEVDNICYLITKSDQVKRVLCDFESDMPSVMIAQTVKEDTDACRAVRRADQTEDQFTFDKRKLGMVPMPCKCVSHGKGKQANASVDSNVDSDNDSDHADSDADSDVDSDANSIVDSDADSDSDSDGFVFVCT